MVEAAGGPTRSDDGEAETEPEPEPELDLRLGTMLQLEAQRAGYARDWRAYVAGRLLLPAGQSPPYGLLAEPAPRSPEAAAALAARWRVDPELLWLVVKTARCAVGSEGGR
jgi:hypothetical protein